MSKFSQVTLSEIGKTVTGKTPSSANPEDFGEGYPFVTPSDSLDPKFIERTARQLSEVGLQRLKGKALPPYSILVSCIGSAMGKVVMNKATCISNQQLNSIIPDQRKHCPEYIYYSLCNNYDSLRNAASGSTALPILNKTDFDLLLLRIHSDLPTQQKIAKVLSTLDAKIELNNRINGELEAMAKLLYDYWFVQFDFPMTAEQATALGQPELKGLPYKASGGKMVFNQTLKREIPEGWEDGTLDKLGEVIGGSTPSKANDDYFCTGGTPWITPKDLSDNKGKKFIQRGGYDVSEQGRKAASLKVMPAGTVLLSSRAPIGYTAIASNQLTTNQGFKSFVPNRGFGTDYVYRTLNHFMKLIEQNASGSTFKEISGGTLKAIKVPFPNNELEKDYAQKVSPISTQQQKLENQNQELTELRDWLLPMLMNGQVTVTD